MTLVELLKWLWGERPGLLDLGGCYQYGCLILIIGFVLLCGLLTQGAQVDAAKLALSPAMDLGAVLRVAVWLAGGTLIGTVILIVGMVIIRVCLDAIGGE